MAIDDSVVYCYLPTQLSLGLPFLVNGDFLLNPERTHLQTNRWNDFVLGCIAHIQIKWLSELAVDTRYQAHVLILLSKGRFSTSQHQIEQAYHRGIESGLAKYPFVPSAALPSTLLFVSSCYIDEMGFYQEFDDHSIRDFIAKHDLQKLDRLKTFGAKVINFDELLPRIETYLKNFPELELSIRILQFLVTKYTLDSIRYVNDNRSLKNYRFILSHAMVAEKPTNLCFMPKQIPDIPIELDVKFVHPTLLNRVPELKTWLQKLGISEPNYGEVIKKYIHQRLEKRDLLMRPDYEQLVNLLFMAFRKKYLLEKEIVSFNNVKLLTKENHLKSPTQCFLSNEYRPEYKLEKHLSTLDIFVNPSYIVNEDDTNLWHDFFKLLGVRSNISVRYYDQFITAQIAIEQWGKSVERYCDYLHVHDGQPKRNSPYRPTFLLYHFMAIDLLEYSYLPDIATLLMLAVVDEFEQVRNYAANASYHGLHASISYLQYYFRFEATLTSTIGNPLPAGKLLGPRFRKCLGAYLPVVDIEIELTQVQSEFFGFTDQLSLEQCLIVFDVLGKKSLPDLAAYAIVIQSLLRLNLTSHDKHEIKLKNILLPTQNNTLSPANTLKFLNIEAGNDLLSSEWLRPMPGLSREQLQEASALLGVKVVESKQTQYQFTDLVEDSVFQKQIVNILPAIALIHAKKLAKEPKDIYQKLYQQMMSLKIYCVKKLELTTERGEFIKICNACIIDAMLLFKNRWDYLSTKQELFKVLCHHLQLDGNIPAIINDIISIELNSPEFNEWLKDLGFNQSDFKQLQEIELVEVDTSIKQEVSPVKESTKEILLKLKQNKEADTHAYQVMEDFAEKEQSDDDSTAAIDSDDADVSSDKATIHSAAINPPRTSSSVNPVIKKQQFNQFNPDKFRKNKGTIQPLQLPEFELYNPISSPGPGRDSKKESSRSQLQSTLIDDEFSSQIGVWGEQAVYYKLSEHYQAKYSNAVFKETNKGFILSQKNFELTLIWHNKISESYESVDFEIHKKVNQEMKKRYLEVKSTRSNKPHKIKISHNEWQLMKEKRQNYRFFRVYNAGDYKNVTIATVKDPYGKLSNDELNLTSLEIKL